MKLKKIMLSTVLLYLIVALEAPIMLNTGEVDTAGNELRIKSADENYVKGEKDLEEGYTQFKTSGGETLEDVLDSFNPDVNITGDYTGESIEGNIANGNTNVILPGKGMYSFEGNISELKAQYMQNPGAEQDVQFYSEGAINVGLGLERIENSVNVTSYSGDYSWKFYSQNTEEITYALYQEDIPLYDTDTEISYHYLLSSKSTLKSVINSSLIFDFVFDTCRIMVIHWHYTDIDPPSIGDNTTSPFIVYRLLQNSSWDNDWKEHSLLISNLFAEGDPFVPTMIKSFGIYVISPETSDCTVLIDDFHIRTSVSPTDINMTINDNAISSLGPGTGLIDIDLDFQEEGDQVYNIIWNHNSGRSIDGNFSIGLSGIIEMNYNKEIVFYNETTLLYSIDIYNLSSLVNQINITYPSSWRILSNPVGGSIISNYDLGNGYKILLLDKQIVTTSIQCDFALENNIIEVNYESITIFEIMNATLVLQEQIPASSMYIFWGTGEMEGDICELTDNNLSYLFPPWIEDGFIDIILLIFDENCIGYQNTTINLLRKPAIIDTQDQIDIPKYAIKDLRITYESLDPYFDIENVIIEGYLDGEIIPAIKENDEYVLLVSSFYLTENEYVLDIIAQSSTHASISKSVNVTVLDSEIIIDFQYELTENPAEYILNFNITSGGLPVGYSPITVDINETTQQTGITDVNGIFTCVVELPLEILIVNITCTIFKITQIICSRTFEVEFEYSLVEAIRSTDDVLIASNITLIYDIQYSINHDRWTYIIEEEMVPILNAYIETDSMRIPVTWDAISLYWQIHADDGTTDHKLVIITKGPSLEISSDEVEGNINIHFVITSEAKKYSDLTILYHFNESYNPSKYDWNLVVNNQKDVSEIHDLEVNGLYAYFTNLDIIQGSILVLDLVGSKIIRTVSMTDVLIPVLASAGVLLGTITVGIRIYNKKKGMILEI